MRLRVFLVTATALGAALTIAGTAVAGGSATVTLDGGVPRPSLGEPVEIGFVLRQHGVTPVSWPQTWVTATHLQSGETVRAEARASGAEGHYVATLTIPSEGSWTWAIESSDLVVTTELPAMTVLAADVQSPASPNMVAVLVATVAIGAAAVVAVATLRRRGAKTTRIDAGRPVVSLDA